MAIRTKVQLGQLTGSLADASGGDIQADFAPVASGSIVATGLGDILSHMASSIKRINGGTTWSNEAVGTFRHGTSTFTGKVAVQGDTGVGDAAAVGYTAAEGIIITGQGSTSDVTIKNDADALVLDVKTGTTNVTFAGNLDHADSAWTIGATVTSPASGITLGGGSDIVLGGDLKLKATGIIKDSGGDARFTAANAAATIISDATGNTGITLHASDLSTTLAGDLTVSGNDLDFAAGAANIGASVGANALTVGGATTAVVVAGTLQVNNNLLVKGVTTTVSSSNMMVKDPIIALGIASSSMAGPEVLGPPGDRGFAFPMDGAYAGSPVLFWDHSSLSSGVPQGAFRAAYANTSGSTTSISPAGLLNMVAKQFNVAGSNDYVKVDTNLQLVAAADIDLKPAAGQDVNLAANIGMTFGDDGEKIEGDGTNLSIASSGELDLTVTGLLDINAAANMDVDVTGTYDVLASGAGSIDFAGDASNITLTSDGAAEDFTISLAGATDSSLILSSTGTAADALQITASAGGIDITATGIAGEDIDIDATTSSVNIDGGEAQPNAIYLNASNAAGGIDMDAGTGGVAIDTTGVLSIDSAGGVSNISHTATANGDFTIAMDGAADASLILSSTGTAADALQIVTTAGGIDITNGGAAGEDIDISSSAASVNISAAEADAAAIVINASAGGATIKAADGFDATLANTAVDAYVKVAAHGTAGSEDIRIVNTNGTDAAAIELTATAGGITFTGANNAKDFTFNTSPLQLASIAAPGASANRLYNVGGTLYWAGAAVTTGGGDSRVKAVATLANATGSNSVIDINAHVIAGGNKTLDFQAVGYDPDRVDTWVNGIMLVSGTQAQLESSTADYSLVGTASIKFGFGLQQDDTLIVTQF